MLDYKRLVREEVTELRRLEHKQRRSAVSYRVQLLRLLKSGECRSLASAAEKLGYSLRQCQRWFKSYRKGGLAALLEMGQPHRTERMTPEAWEALEKALKAGEVASLEQARQLLDKHGVVYKGVAGVSALFIRHKVKLKTGRPRHAKSDETMQVAFKKTSLLR